MVKKAFRSARQRRSRAKGKLKGYQLVGQIVGQIINRKHTTTRMSTLKLAPLKIINARLGLV